MILRWQNNMADFGKYSPQYTLWRKKSGEGGGGRGEGGDQSENWELRTAFSKQRIHSCLMSIMAFELPIIEIAFALSELEFKKSTFNLELLLLEIDFRIWVLTFNGHSRPP